MCGRTSIASFDSASLHLCEARGYGANSPYHHFVQIKYWYQIIDCHLIVWYHNLSSSLSYHVFSRSVIQSFSHSVIQLFIHSVSLACVSLFVCFFISLFVFSFFICSSIPFFLIVLLFIFGARFWSFWGDQLRSTQKQNQNPFLNNSSTYICPWWCVGMHSRTNWY